MKAINTIVLLLITNFVFSQTPAQVVTDPGNNAQLVKTVENTLKTLKVSKENLAMAKEAIEAAKKVNSAVKSSKMALQIIDNLRTTYDNLSSVPNLMEDIKNPTIRKNLVKHCNELFIDIDVFQDTATNVLTDQILKMEDSERLTVLMGLYDKSKDVLAKSDRLNKLIKATK